MNALSEPWWCGGVSPRHPLLVIALVFPALALAQPLLTSPTAPLTEMLHPPRNNSTYHSLWRIDFAVAAETNVRPLYRRTEAVNFSDATVYYRASSLWVLQHERGRWKFSWERALTDYFEGNSGAGQLYQEMEQKQLSPDTRYAVQVKMNRNELFRWAIAYTGQISRSGGYTLRLHWTQFMRVQQGELVGFKNQDHFEGQLYLESTRGVPSRTPQGEGLGIDIFLHYEGTPSWQFWMGVENLWSTIRIGRTQAIEARVSAGYLEPDAEGFLRAVPLIEGRTWLLSAHRTATRRAFLGFRNAHIGGLGIWDVQAHYVLIIHPSQHIWIALWLPSEQLRIGFQQKQWGLGLGADHFDWGRWRSISLQVAYYW